MHVGEDVLLGAFHQRGELGHLGAELVGHRAPLGVGGGCVLLGVGGADPGRDDAALRLACVGQRIAGEVDAAALPGGAQHLRHGGLQALMCVGDDELHARQAAPLQAAEEIQPEGLRLGAADGHAEDLAPPVGVDTDRDGHGYRDDAPGLTDLHVGGVKPEIGPVALDGPSEEIANAVIDLGAEAADLAATDPLRPPGGG